MRRLLLGLVALLIAAAAGPAVATATPAIGGFSARALGPDGEVTPQTYFQQTLAPGDTFTGTLLVNNTSHRTAKLSVYSVDGLTGNTSGTVYANKADARVGVSLWTTPAKSILRMDPTSDRRIKFTVKVPDDATPGDHVGAIALESARKPKQSKGQFGVTEVIRVAVAISIRVKGPANAALKLNKLAITALPGTQIPSVTINMSNTGQLLCRPAISLALSQGGTGLGTETRQLDTILAGKTIPYPMAWKNPLKGGTYHAKVGATGCGAPVSIEADLKLKGDLSGTARAPGTNTLPAAKGGGVPWWALVIAVVVALVGGFFLARRKPREKKTDEPAAPAAE